MVEALIVVKTWLCESGHVCRSGGITQVVSPHPPLLFPVLWGACMLRMLRVELAPKAEQSQHLVTSVPSALVLICCLIAWVPLFPSAKLPSYKPKRMYTFWKSLVIPVFPVAWPCDLQTYSPHLSQPELPFSAGLCLTQLQDPQTEPLSSPACPICSQQQTEWGQQEEAKSFSTRFQVEGSLGQDNEQRDGVQSSSYFWGHSLNWYHSNRRKSFFLQCLHFQKITKGPETWGLL